MKDSGKARERRLAGCLLAIAAIGTAACASTGVPEGVDRQAAPAIVGDWGLQIRQADHTEEAVLHFSFDHEVLQGSYRGSDGRPLELTNVRLSEGKISWDLDVRSGTIHSKGTVNGAIMSGKMTIQLSSQGPEESPGAGPQGFRAGQSRDWTAYRRVEAALPAPPAAANVPEEPAKPVAPPQADRAAGPEPPGMSEAEIRRRASHVYIEQDEAKIAACKELGKIDVTAPLAGGVVEIQGRKLAYRTATELVRLKTVEAGGNAFLSRGLVMGENEISYRGVAYLCSQP